MTDTVAFSDPFTLASYLYSRAATGGMTPWERVLLATMCAERAAELWGRYA